MAGKQILNFDIDVRGKAIIYTVPNATGTVLTYNPTTKEVSTRTNAEFISDMNLMTTNTEQNVEGVKWFRTAGGSAFSNHKLRVLSEDGSNPGMVFWKEGANIGILNYDGNFNFYTNGNNSDYTFAKASGFIKNNSDNSFVLTGGGSHKSLNNFLQLGDSKDSINISSTDLNDLLQTGFFRGSGLTNAPDNAPDWFFITVEYHYTGWATQTATAYGTGSIDGGKTFKRSYQGASFWTPWREIVTNNQLSNYLTNGSAIQIDGAVGINNGSDTRTNKTWFEYNWANTGRAGSVINFSGLSGNYSTEIFGAYGNGDEIGFRTKNGNQNTWNPHHWIWHTDNFNPANYATTSQLNDVVYLSVPQTIIANKNYAPSSEVNYLGNDGSVVKVLRKSSGISEVVSGHEYCFYGSRWKVGNKRGGGANTVGFTFNISNDDGVNYSEVVRIDGDSTILTATTGTSYQWNQAFNWGNHALAGYALSSQLGNYYTKPQTVYAINGDEANNISSFDDLNGKTQLGAISVGGLWWYTINIQHRNGSGDGGGYAGQIRFGMTGQFENLQFRQRNSNQYNDWKTIWNSGNLNPANFATQVDLTNYVDLNTYQDILGQKAFGEKILAYDNIRGSNNSSDHIFTADGELAVANNEIINQDQKIRLIPYDEVFSGSQNSFDTKNRRVRVTVMDGGTLRLNEGTQYQEIVVMNPSPNECEFVIPSHGVNTRVDSKSSATFYINKFDQVVQVRIDQGTCAIVN